MKKTTIAILTPFICMFLVTTVRAADLFGDFEANPIVPVDSAAITEIGTTTFKHFAFLDFAKEVAGQSERLEAFVGINGKIIYLENNGAEGDPPLFTLADASLNPFSTANLNPQFPAGYPIRLASTDLNGDDYPDLVVSDFQNTELRIFLHNGDDINPSFSEYMGDSPFPGFTETEVTPGFVDVSGDGIDDALFGEDPGTIHYLIAASTVAPGALREYTVPSANDNPFDPINLASIASLAKIAPTLAFMDDADKAEGDRKKDLVIGSGGGVYFFPATATGYDTSQYTDSISSNNSTAVFADITGDGKDEMFLGSTSRSLNSDAYWVIPEPVHILTLADIMKGLQALAGIGGITAEEVANIDLGTATPDGILALDDIVASIIRVANPE